MDDLKQITVLTFPNAKINLGLRVLEKRADGYHNIETLFCPVALCDVLEFVPADLPAGQDIHFNHTGYDIKGELKKNLCVKAYRLLSQDFKLPPLKVHLHKLIPVGAGLGGGSADAAFMLKSLNTFFQLGLSEKQLSGYASLLGSDCAFFIQNKPLLGTGRGDVLNETGFSPGRLEMVIINPGIHINTAEAYQGIIPQKPEISLKELLGHSPGEWRTLIQNDFESFVFQQHPVVAQIKKQLYEQGAIYASMSGSGSSVYGIFNQAPSLKECFKNMFYWKGSMNFQQNN